MVSYPSDAALAAIFEDNRVAKRVGEIIEAVEDEIDWLANVDLSVWDRLASVLNPEETSGFSLRSECIAGGHIACIFITGA